MRWHDEERFDLVLEKEGVPFMAVAWLHLVVSVETLQGGFGDVDFAVEQEHTEMQRVSGTPWTDDV